MDIDANTWHAKLGCLSQNRMCGLTCEGLLGTFTKLKLSIYEYCLARKTSRKPFGKAIRA